MKETLDTSLTRSIATQSLADVLGAVSETTLDAALDSGLMREIPVIGMITGGLKAARDVKSALFLRKVAIFLKTIAEISDDERKEFIEEIEGHDKQHRFGESILLLLERAEDMKKPAFIARIIGAYIKGAISEKTAFRICSMIDRCYIQDLDLLRSFKNGTQGENSPIAESLQSVGFLSNGGFDGGTPSQNSGGVIYYLNEYGKLFVQYALDGNTQP